MKHYDFRLVLRNYLIAEGVIVLFAVLYLLQGIRRGDIFSIIIFSLAGIIFAFVFFCELRDYRGKRIITRNGTVQNFGRFLNSNKAILIGENGQLIKVRIMGMKKEQLKSLIGKRIEVYQTKTFKNIVELKVFE